MFEHKKIQSLDDFFAELDGRPGKGVYFYRICGYTQEIGQFVREYYQAARKSGVVLEGKIANPSEQNLSYYNEIMGADFQMNQEFISASLRKWLPRMNDYQRGNVAASLYSSLDGLRKTGKNDNMLKNAYIKFMCWLYYKFERIVNQLGQNTVPKILYEGDVSRYEWMLLSILSHAGCDIVLLQYQGDENYRRLDADSSVSDYLELPGMTAFPPGFGLRRIRDELRLYGQRPMVGNCTNAWITGKGLEDIRTDPASRGNDPKLFYNCYCRINGVEDKQSYLSQLYQFHLEMKNSKRNIAVVNEVIPRPTMAEIEGIRRNNYEKTQQMLMDLSANIQYAFNSELQRLMVQAFLDVMLQEAQGQQVNLNQLTNKAVYLLCWLKRYQGKLFQNWNMPDIGCFIYMGGCKDGRETLFIKFLARLPVDVLILTPDLGTKCCLEDSLLYEIHYSNTLAVSKFPQDDTDVHIGTAAYHAEQELDTLMYQDSGMYRNRQYGKANVVILQTMYEEIRLLWNEEVKYRPSFSTVEGVVSIPVIFAKVSGVKDGQISQYWQSVRELVTENTYVVKSVPFIDSAAENPMKAYAVEFLKNAKVQKEKIKKHPHYPYGYLREEVQDYMLEKLQMLIDRKIIKGTFENGMEYTIISTVLNLPKELVRMIQNFDFTRKNPKLLYIHTGEAVISREDSILTAYLNLIGFDVVFFIPTGYETIERHFNKRIMEEHQIGEYVYDLQVPSLESFSAKARTKWRDKIFKRGR